MFPPNKKVGFRPLQEFDTYNSIVACPEENATFGGKCVYPGRPVGPIFTNKANLRLQVRAEKANMHVQNFRNFC